VLSDATVSIPVGQFERLGAFVVAPDIASDFAGEVGFGSKDAAGDQIALNFGEPDFDLIEPGTISRGVMQRDLWMIGKEAIDDLGFVRLEVVGDELARGCVATTSARKATNSALVWRWVVLPKSCPLETSRAA
jgi:hypothetical protein